MTVRNIAILGEVIGIPPQLLNAMKIAELWRVPAHLPSAQPILGQLTLYDGYICLDADDGLFLLHTSMPQVFKLLKADVDPRKFQEPAGATPLSPPSILEKATNLTVAVYDWAKSGFKLADVATQTSRSETCNACEFWKKEDYAGLGQCLKCGCSGFKWKLATTSCPIGKWNAVVNS